LTKPVALIAALASIVAGCGGTRVPDGPVNLDGMRADSKPYYWVGESFEGLDLTYAERYSGRFSTLAYGTCEPPRSEGGCAPPLEIQNARCSSSHGINVAIFGRTRLARRAAKSLRPLNRAAREAPKPQATFDRSILC